MIITQNEKMLALLDVVKKIGCADVPVMIVGETGTGKELLAEYVCETSLRAGKKFVKMNCAAIPENLIESELFGHVRGAFTGANAAKTGSFEFAHHGTIFLDEIGDLPQKAQASLLRITQDGEFKKVGGNDVTKVDVRIVCATNKDLFSNGFRRDLYYRLAMIVLEVPPLRNRGEDVLLLARHFCGEYCEKIGVEPKEIAGPALKKLESHSWPGNVRELQNVIFQAVLVSGPEITAQNIMVGGANPFIRPAINATNFDLQENEIALISRAMVESGGVQKLAAPLLGISPRALSYKVRLYKLEKWMRDV